jgi:hypothetical protein
MPEAKVGLEIDGGTEVKMAFGTTQHAGPTIATEEDGPLWTVAMTDCCAIATFDIDASSGKTQRTLYHAAGSNPPDSYFDQLAKLIPKGHDVTVIISNGSDDLDKEIFLGRQVDNIKTKLSAAMKELKKPMTQVVFKTHFTLPKDDDKNKGQKGSFVIDESGFWGRKEAAEAKPAAKKAGTSAGPKAASFLATTVAKPAQAKPAAGDEEEEAGSSGEQSDGEEGKGDDDEAGEEEGGEDEDEEEDDEEGGDGEEGEEAEESEKGGDDEEGEEEEGGEEEASDAEDNKKKA